MRASGKIQIWKEAVLDADFLKECIITNSAFSFVFGNPPYMTGLNFERSAGIKMKEVRRCS